MIMPMGEHFRQDDRIEIMTIRQHDIELHSHAFLEIAYILSGQTLHTLGDTDMTVGQGDYFIIDYGVEHRYTLINGEPFELVNILLRPELLDKTLQKCRSFQELVNHYLIRIDYASLEQNPTGAVYHDTDGSIRRIIERMKTEYENKNPGYIELLRCHTIEIVIHTVRTLTRRSAAVSRDDISAGIREYIDKNYMHPITLSQLSRDMNYSLSYLSRKFKADTGFTFVTCLQRKRMEQSARLIANTRRKIDEIAGLVGYQDVKFFQKKFKEFWHVTPSDFRKSFQSGYAAQAR